MKLLKWIPVFLFLCTVSINCRNCYYRIKVKSSPAGANVVVGTKSFIKNEYISPCEITLQADDDYQISITKQGYKNKYIRLYRKGGRGFRIFLTIAFPPVGVPMLLTHKDKFFVFLSPEYDIEGGVRKGARVLLSEKKETVFMVPLMPLSNKAPYSGSFCPSCGKQTNPENRFCPSCGKRLKE